MTEDDVKKLVGEDADLGLHISSEAELIKRLQELKRYQQLGQKLWELPKLGHEIYPRQKWDKRALIADMIKPMDIQELINTKIIFLSKQKRKHQVIKKERFSIRDRLIKLKEFLHQDEQTDFFKVLESEARDFQSREERQSHAIVTFISLLELARLKKVRLYQNKHYENIFIDTLESLTEFNVDLADGFEQEPPPVPMPNAINESSLQH